MSRFSGHWVDLDKDFRPENQDETRPMSLNDKLRTIIEYDLDVHLGRLRIFKSYFFPVEPKPPAPRSVSDNSVAI